VVAAIETFIAQTDETRLRIDAQEVLTKVRGGQA
jgi:hypothetical protein